MSSNETSVGFCLGPKGVNARTLSRGGSRDYVAPTGRGEESADMPLLSLPVECVIRAVACSMTPLTPWLWPAIWLGGWR